MTKDEEMMCSKVFKLWGADDCRFTVREIADVLQIPKEKVDYYIKLVKEERPKIYKKHSNARNHVNKQNDFESEMTSCDNTLMDETFSKERMDYDSPPPAKDVDLSIRKALGKNRDQVEQDKDGGYE